jgi:DNA repair protein RecO (recombination protein O)
MALKESEAIVLRSYPLRESDLLVTFFTRAEGKVKGVAKAAKKSRKRFGGALELVTCVRVFWEDREHQELARIDSCEVLDSPLAEPVDYRRLAALGHVAELLDELLPDREANDTIFRLALSVLRNLRGDAIWMPVTYFELWMARLVGFLPGLGECVVCGKALNPPHRANNGRGGDPGRGDVPRAWFHALVDGLMCQNDKRLASSELSVESRALAAEMFRTPVDALAGEAWPRKRGADLRKFIVQLLERHIDKKLVTARMLEKIE